MEYDEAVEATGYEKALSESSYWYVAEAVDMLLGAKPIKGNGRDPTPALREIAYRAIDTGDLPCFGEPEDRMVRPADFIAWAEGKGWNIPPRIRALLDKRPPMPIERDPAPAPAPAPLTESHVDEAPGVEAGRTVAWKAELIELWSRIAEAYSGRPTALQAMAYLKKHGSPDVFPKDQPDRYSLRWIDADGHPQTVKINTVGTAISFLRKKGLIPPRKKQIPD